MHGNVHGEAERRQGDRQNGEEDHVTAALEDPPNQRQHLGRMLSTVVRLQASGAILISIAVLLQRRQFLRLREGKVGEVLAVLPEHDRLLVVHHRASPPVRRPPLLGGHIGAGAVVVLHRWLVGGGEVFNQAETTPNQRKLRLLLFRRTAFSFTFLPTNWLRPLLHPMPKTINRRRRRTVKASPAGGKPNSHSLLSRHRDLILFTRAALKLSL